MKYFDWFLKFMLKTPHKNTLLKNPPSLIYDSYKLFIAYLNEMIKRFVFPSFL